MADDVDDQDEIESTDRVIRIDAPNNTGRRVTFEIGGERYRFAVPKLYGLVDTVKHVTEQRSSQGSGLTDIQVFAKIESWLFDCLDPTDAEDLRARLLDPKDEVDVDHLIQVFQHLTKEASGRPSGRRRTG